MSWTVLHYTQNSLKLRVSTNEHAKVPQHGFLAQKVKWSEPLIQKADPHITKLAIGAWMCDKDGPNKIINK